MKSSLAVWLLIAFGFLILHGTSQEQSDELKSQNDKLNVDRTKDSGENESDQTRLNEKIIEKLTLEQKGTEKHSDENDQNNDDINDDLEKFGNVLLSKLDEPLKNKLKSVIENEIPSIDSSLFQELSDEEKEKIKTAFSESLSPFLGQVMQELAGYVITEDNISFEPSFNFSLEQNKNEAKLKNNDEL